ncbi:MAG: hypothetical protein M1360_02350 [Candidatus Marsarchaeota archaeon]|jgi:hypothetical protein|nr:hypothetical protein [Candidatus Marsarchaeota archaeon]MCL5418759.1 hypothetical protein [Candidatus Marsarchaeota archaeon]
MQADKSRQVDTISVPALRSDDEAKEFSELAKEARKASGAAQEELLGQIMEKVLEDPKKWSNEAVTLLAGIMQDSVLENSKNLSDIEEALTLVCVMLEPFIDKSTKARINEITLKDGFVIGWRE